MADSIPVFTHSGALGDVLYSLPFCQAFSRACGHEQFDFFITANLPFTHGHQHPAGSVMTSLALANFLLPLLQSQALIRQAGVIDLHQVDRASLSHCHNLDHFRHLPINLAANHLANHYFYLTNAVIKKDFHTPTLQVTPDARAAGKIIGAGFLLYALAYGLGILGYVRGQRRGREPGYARKAVPLMHLL